MLGVLACKFGWLCLRAITLDGIWWFSGGKGLYSFFFCFDYEVMDEVKGGVRFEIQRDGTIPTPLPTLLMCLHSDLGLLARDIGGFEFGQKPIPILVA